VVSDELGWLTDALMIPTFWLSLISWLVLFCGIDTDMYRYHPRADREHLVIYLANLCTRHIPKKLTPRGHEDWPDKRRRVDRRLG